MLGYALFPLLLPIHTYKLFTGFCIHGWVLIPVGSVGCIAILVTWVTEGEKKQVPSHYSRVIFQGCWEHGTTHIFQLSYHIMSGSSPWPPRSGSEPGIVPLQTQDSSIELSDDPTRSGSWCPFKRPNRWPCYVDDRRRCLEAQAVRFIPQSSCCESMKIYPITNYIVQLSSLFT